MNSDVKSKRIMFNNMLRWKVYNGDLTDLKSYRINFFKYHFVIKDKELLESFIELVTNDEGVPQHKICNFFLEKGINYKLRFYYLKEATIKENWIMFAHVIKLNVSKMKVLFNRRFHINIKFRDKKNDKKANCFHVDIVDLVKMRVTFFQVDFNICWLPKLKSKVSEKSKTTYLAWLIFLIGTIRYKALKYE